MVGGGGVGDWRVAIEKGFLRWRGGVLVVREEKGLKGLELERKGEDERLIKCVAIFVFTVWVLDRERVFL